MVGDGGGLPNVPLSRDPSSIVPSAPVAANGGDEALGADADREGLAFAVAVSAFSATAGEVVSSMCVVDALGLSVFDDVPGIFDRIEPLKDFIDSFVSDLLKEG